MKTSRRILIAAAVVLALVPGATGAPPKPSGLTVVSWTSTSLGINWNASTNGATYGVYLGSTRVASTTATNYTFTGLTCGTSYQVGVGAGKRSPSEWVVTTTLACPSPPPPPPPPPLAALAFASPTAGTISGAIAWEVTSPVAVDRIEFSLDGGAARWTERAAPFMFNGDPNGRLDTTTLTNGTHTLSVDGYDAAGTRVAAASKTVNVSNTAPAPPALPSVSIGDVSVTEGAAGTTTATVTLTLSGPTTTATTVARSTANITATAGSDYTAASGTVTFAAGATTAQTTVSVLGDTTVEANETFQVALSAPSGLTIADGTGVVTIVNDDTAPSPSPPTPPATSGCFSAPAACGFPDPASGNVGVPAGKTLTDSGSITVTQAGAVIDGLNIRGNVTVLANNVTIQNSKITAVSGGGFNGRLIGVCGGCTFTIKDSELTTLPGISYEFGIHGASQTVGGSNITMERVYQHGEIDAMLWVEGTGVVRDTYSIIGKPNGAGWQPALPGDHLENIYINNATLTVDHSVILNPVPQTSTIFGNTNNGVDGQPCQNKLTITNNLLAGGGQMVTACAHAASSGSSNVSISNNRFARCGMGREVQGGGGTWLCAGLTIGASDGAGYYPRGGSFMLITGYFPAQTTWSGNVWDDNGNTVPKP